ncbi:MAG: flippase, partial [Methanoculleus sp.]
CIRVRVESRPVANIILAALAMSAAVAAFSYIVPLTNVFVLLGAIALGGVAYMLVLLKLDRGIRDELKDLAEGLGIPWPEML